jgi:hypothetical protein
VAQAPDFAGMSNTVGTGCPTLSPVLAKGGIPTRSSHSHPVADKGGATDFLQDRKGEASGPAPKFGTG